MNIRGWLYSRYSSFRGRDYFSLFEKLCQEFHAGISPETTRTKLRDILQHCKTNIPYLKNWIYKFQVTQKSYLKILIKIIKSNSNYQPKQQELDEIVDQCKIAMGEECQVQIEFVDQIKSSYSGKYRYTISEI